MKDLFWPARVSYSELAVMALSCSGYHWRLRSLTVEILVKRDSVSRPVWGVAQVREARLFYKPP